MSTNPPIDSLPKFSPGVMSLLPLYYVGWADNVLSPSEVRLIRKKIKQLPFLDKADKALLDEWSDPAQPPRKDLFKHWVALIRKTSVDLPMRSRNSLAALGVEMAKRSATPDDAQLWASSKTHDAIAELEDALGGISMESYRNIFPADTPPETGTDPEASFDVSAMTALLDDDYADIRNQMRILLSDPIFELVNIRNKEQYREHVLAWCKLLANRGLGATSYPEAYGGKDDMGHYAAIFEMLGYHDSSLTIKFGVQFGLWGGSVLWLGTKRHHDKYLKDIGTLELPGCFAMTETGHGSNVRGLETTATYDSKTDELIVHSPSEAAGKEYIGNALHGRMGSVFCQLIVDGVNHGVHAVVVPLRDKKGQLLPGVRIEDCGYKLGLNGVDNGRIWFDQVRVPRENLLNRFGDINEQGVYTSPIDNPSRRFFTMLGTLVGGRVCVPRAGLSAAKSGLTIAIKYALKRRQFAPKEGESETILLDYPSHQRRLMPHLAKAYALDFALTWLSKRYVNRTEDDIREIETLAAGLKSYATWFTTEALQECREACGGKGYLAENRFADLKADTDIYTTFEGDNTVLMQLVAKGLLSSFRQEFHNEGFRAVMRYLATQVTTGVTELNPIATRKTDVEHLRDPDFQLNAFRYRERKLLYSVSQRMRRLLGKRMDPYDAFLRCQVHMLSLANAYVERLVLEQFVAAVSKVEDAALRKALKNLCDLYALHTIESHKDFYLENDYMQGVKTKAIRRVVNKLCRDVRAEAGAYVDAFAIPRASISAAII
ncbi:MAG: acyl-CoA dehydrogenase [Bacteroidota bacterium]